MNKPDIAIVMPAFNEAGAITGFLTEIFEAKNFGQVSVVVVNDCSTDGTADDLNLLINQGLPLRVISNTENLGHGPSTIKALCAGLGENPDIVVSTDGDGQIRAQDLLDMAQLAFESNSIVEGVRTNRRDQWFRVLTSMFTRVLVGMRAGIFPRDANTPFRAYPAKNLRDLLRDLNSAAMTPNMIISAAVRMRSLQLLEYAVETIQRQGAVENGVTWRQKFKFLPSERFIRFIWAAAGQWVDMVPEAPLQQSRSQRILRGLLGRGSAGRYALIGISGVFIDFFTYAALVWLGLYPVIATTLSTPLGILNNYVWNSRLNFRMAISRVRGIKFLAVGVSGLMASAVLIFVFTQLGASALVSKVFAVPLVVLGQFFLNKFWTFSRWAGEG